jgi:transcriptional regulator GlxA family with amidase domain
MDAERTVGILIFDDVEVLDCCGPFEVFSVAGRRDGRNLFRVVTIGRTHSPVLARGGLSINPHHTLDDCPPLDILVVPGGYGTRREMLDDTLLAWIRQASSSADLTLSVCTGALLLGRAGLLDGRDATTHHGAFELLAQVAPAARVDRTRRVIDNGDIIVSAGVASGIDMSLYVLARLHGHACAEETAAYIEYDWRAERVPPLPA